MSDRATVEAAMLHNVRIKNQDIKFRVDDPYSRDWFLPRYTGGLLHEPSVSRDIAERLQPDEVFVDVGAHVGYFAVLAAKFCKKVFAFEMQRCLMPLIERNININGFTNVHAINAAVGDKRGLAGYSRAQFSALLGVYPGIDPDDYAPMITLDDMMSNLENISIIKIDVEGQVLEGGRNTLWRCRALLFLECPRTLEQYGWSYSKLLTFLEAAQYRFFRYEDHRADGGAVLRKLTSADANQLPDNTMLYCEPRRT